MSAARVILGVTGSIAAYRAADIASSLSKQGVEVDVILTDGGQKFITPLTFSALTHRSVVTNLWDEEQNQRPSHIQMADSADLALVAPASANVLARMTYGMADDALTSTLLATRAPILVAPAMNGKMWSHPATEHNVQVLKERGVRFIGPDEGMLACGYEGAGRLWPVTEIVAEVIKVLEEAGKAV